MSGDGVVPGDGAVSFGFLDAPSMTPDALRLFDSDVDEVGYVMNASRLWGYQPTVLERLFGLMKDVSIAADLSVRQRGILVAAMASTLRDSYCSLAWGSKLADQADASVAAGVLRGDDDGLTPAEHAMAEWARTITNDPGRASQADIESLRATGFSDGQIFAMTTFVALRIAFSTVNGALGALPDASLRTSVPTEVIGAVAYGRPIAPD